MDREQSFLGGFAVFASSILFLLIIVSVPHVPTQPPASQGAISTCIFGGCHGAGSGPVCMVSGPTGPVAPGQTLTYSYDCSNDSLFFIYGSDGYDSRGAPLDWVTYAYDDSGNIALNPDGSFQTTSVPPNTPGAWCAAYMIPVSPFSPNGPQNCYSGGLYGSPNFFEGQSGTFTLTPTKNTTYTAYDAMPSWCNGSSCIFGTYDEQLFSIPITVTAAKPPPTASIDAGAGNGATENVTVGAPVTVTATYTPGSGDTLAATAINDNSTGSSVPCTEVSPLDANCWQVPDSTKTYTFTPTSAGSWTFSAQAEATGYVPFGCTSSNCYDSYATVTVVASCPPSHTVGAPSSDCGSPSAPPPAATCTDPNALPPSCTTCQFGYHLSGGVCVPTTCSDPHAVPPLCSTCVAGYTYNGSMCVVVPAISLTASPTLVRHGGTSNISWSVSDLTGDPSVSCSITSDTGVFSQSMPVGTSPTWSGSAETGPIDNSTNITLSCSGAASKTVAIKINPNYIEQ